MASIETNTETGETTYFNDDGEEIMECCYEAETGPMPGMCGDCFGGTDEDPYVNGTAVSYAERQELNRRAEREARGFAR